MRAIVFVNGLLDEYDWLKALIQDDDILICADGGTLHCLACDRIPHIVVGDVDSLDAETAAILTEKGVRFERHPAAKNETDLELAIDAALRQSAAGTRINEILLVGALGGRLDQQLANLLILAQRDWPILMRIVNKEESAQLVQGGETVTIEGQIGDTLSAIPISDATTGITYTGLLYPLENHTLTMGSTRGISNEFAQKKATISVGSGKLLIVHWYLRGAGRDQSSPEGI